MIITPFLRIISPIVKKALAQITRRRAMGIMTTATTHLAARTSTDKSLATIILPNSHHTKILRVKLTILGTNKSHKLIHTISTTSMMIPHPTTVKIGTSGKIQPALGLPTQTGNLISSLPMMIMTSNLEA